MKKNLPLYVMLILFITPFIAAHIAFANKDKININSTHFGKMHSPGIEILINNKPLEKKWSWLHIIPEECNEECNKQLKVFNNMQIALGKMQNQVNKIIASKKQISLLGINDNERTELLSEHNVLIIDSYGKVVLHYDKLMERKNIMKDLKHLVKFNSYA